MSSHYSWKGYLYLAWNEEQLTIGLTPWPLVDMAYLYETKKYQQLLCITPEIPLGLAYWLGQQLTHMDLTTPITLNITEAHHIIKGSMLTKPVQWLLGQPKSKQMKNIIEQLQQKAVKYLKQQDIKPQCREINYQEAAAVQLDFGRKQVDLAEILAGRLLFIKEIYQGLTDNGLEELAPFQLKLLLQLMYLKGDLELWPSIVYQGQGRYTCLRCGTDEKLQMIPCLDCGGNCLYCEQCQTMGESRLCRPLYGISQEEVNLTTGEEVQPQLSFSLTKAQQDASNEGVEFVQEPATKQALVWAVCGAGKTEVSFATISHVLSQGGKVLFAIPRRDVVLELIPRLEKAFPQVAITALYGGSQGKYEPAQLVLATTHQTIRFYRQFDLVVLDEVDAYPYKDSDMLRYAVERAKKKKGKLMVMSATPDNKTYREAKQGKIKLIHIPARHHGYPVPEPKFIIGNHCRLSGEGKVSFSKEVLQFIHQTIEGDLAQLFIFTPSIFLTEQVGKGLQQRIQLPPFNNFDGQWVQYSHSRDPHRDEKRRGFVEGDYPILVSTTIMERGITVTRANVLVLFAHYQQIFDSGTLVQMAGRAGRSSIYPLGKVAFVGEKITHQMTEALARINEQNKEAAHRGYLRDVSISRR